MAQGDVNYFDQFWTDVGNKLHNLSTDTFYIGIVGNGVTPAQTTADPRWGAGGTTDFSAQEVTPGGNYSAGGENLSAVITDNWTSSSGTDKLDFDDVSIAQDASNPSGCYYGIVYNFTDTGKRCVGWIDLGGPLNLAGGPLTITWHANGFLALIETP